MSTTVRTHEEVRVLAYQFWQGRGEPWGTPETDWFRAEHELADGRGRYFVSHIRNQFDYERLAKLQAA